MKILLLKLWRKIERGFKRLYRPYVMKRLKLNNQQSQKSIVSANGPIVSLTTFGERVHSVFYTIESIGAGEVLPSKISLWIGKSMAEKDLPESLKRLEKRGLIIHLVDDLGPHTKYFYEIKTTEHSTLPFVTADDDILYPKNWLSTFINEHKKYPEDILCFRAHKISFDGSENLNKYSKWNPCLSKTASHLHFSTGVCGVFFPSIMRTPLSLDDLRFLECCPKADDIWLNHIALKASLKVRQVVSVPKRFYEIPGTREEALANFNNGQGENDRQLAATYYSDQLKYLHSLERH